MFKGNGERGVGGVIGKAVRVAQGEISLERMLSISKMDPNDSAWSIRMIRLGQSEGSISSGWLLGLSEWGKG